MNTDLIVIGGGVLGTFHAYFARQRGLSVTLLERNSQPVGATVRNFGQVVPSGMNEHWQQLGRRSLNVYNEIQAVTDVSVRNNGTIYIASDDEELRLLEELSMINQSVDYPSELWTADQCRRRYPRLRENYVVGGLFFPQELSVNPRVMIHRVHDLLRQQGVSVKYNACVCDVDSSGSKAVCLTTDGCRFEADQVILCGGSEFGLLYPQLFQESDIEVVKLQMVLLESQIPGQLPGNILTGLSIRRYESFEACPSYREIKNREPQDAFWKRWGVHILFKQEADGSIILGDSHQYASVPQCDTLDYYINDEVVQYFVDQGKKIIALPAWNVRQSWYGMYSQTRDGRGIFQTTIDGRVHVATAIGGKGMTGSAGFAEQHLEKVFND